MPKGPAIRGCTADLTGSKVGDEYLRRWLSLGEIRQRTIELRLVGSLLVVVNQISVEGALQAAPTDEPAAAYALARSVERPG